MSTKKYVGRGWHGRDERKEIKKISARRQRKAVKLGLKRMQQVSCGIRFLYIKSRPGSGRDWRLG